MTASTMAVGSARHRRPPARSLRLYRDATSLAASSMLTAVLGMAFWVAAARVFPPERLGVQTALLSALTAPAIVVGTGIGDAFTAVLPAAAQAARLAVLRRGYRMLLLWSSIAGVVAALVSVTVLAQVRGSTTVAVLVAVGTVVWALFTVQDSALTSMGRARWLPIENGSVSVAKIALLPLLAWGAVAMPLVVATVLPAAAAVAVLYRPVRRLADRSDPAPQLTDAYVPDTQSPGPRELTSLAYRTTSSIALSLGTLTLLPFLVTVIAGPTQGAVFALCLSIAQSLDFVSSAVGVSLVVHASAGGADGGSMARMVLPRTAALVGAAGLALVSFSPVLLGYLGHSYLALHAVAVIAILCVGSLVRTVFVIWSALQRSRRRLRPVLVLNAVAACTVYVLIGPLCGQWGAVGAAAALVAAQLVLAVGAAGHVVWTGRS